MCTPEQAKEESMKAIEETLFTPDIHGRTRFQREVHDAVFSDGDSGQPSRFQRELKKAYYSYLGRWLIGGGVAIIIAGALLYAQVQENTTQLREGGRYTESDSIEDKRLQEARDSRQDDSINSLRTDMTTGFISINQKLDRLTEYLIP